MFQLQCQRYILHCLNTVTSFSVLLYVGSANRQLKSWSRNTDLCDMYVLNLNPHNEYVDADSPHASSGRDLFGSYIAPDVCVHSP